MKPKVGPIAGITGEDGSYLTELLLKKGYIVHGIKHQASGFNTQQVDPRHFHPTGVETLLGVPSKAKIKLSWTPQISVQQMCHEMVANSAKEARSHDFLKVNG